MLAGLVVALLVSVQWLPWLELYRDGRPFTARGKPEFATVGALHPKELLILLFPDALGNPYAGIPSPHQPLWFYHEKACYVGLVTLGLIVIGLASRRRRRWQLPMLVLCGLALMMAMGGNSPLFRLTSALLPGPTQFYCPARVGALLCFFAPLLAASGLEAVLNREASVGGRWRGPPSCLWACWPAAPPRWPCVA